MKKIPELDKTCTGCMACVYACPASAITVNKNTPSIDEKKCFGCWHCVEVCEARAEKRELSLLKYMPQKDCGKCGKASCSELLCTKELEKCPLLSTEMRRALKFAMEAEQFMNVPVTDTIIPTKTGFFEIGRPKTNSPVIVTSNYIHTTSNIALVLESCGIDAYVMVVDTGGYCMALALTLGNFLPGSLKDEIKNSGLEKKVFHRLLILPEQAKIVDFSEIDWEIVFGPNRMEELPAFLIKNWNELLEDFLLESMIY